MPDPTLLLQRTDWDKVSKYNLNLNNYIFCYFLSWNEDHWKYVENVSQQFMNSFCQGWELALKEEAAPREASLLLNAPNSMAGGYAKTMELLDAGEMPEAVFCASDEQAFGVLKAAHEKGVRVPEELAVAGFTDSPMSNLCDPELTTIDLPIYRLGIIAARMLFDVIEDTGSEVTPGEVVLQPKLRIRRSCGNEKPINVLFE